MYPAAFEYHTPASVREALGLLGRLGDDAKVIAGGHSLIPMMKLRLAQPKHLVDLRKVPGLSGIREDGGQLVFGALTTHWQIESSDLVRRRAPMLAEVAALIGDPQVRNLGTIGGSLAHADPAADWPAAVLATGAEIVCEGPKGRRAVAADEWFRGLMTTALNADELVVEVRVPVWGSGAAYLKFPHPASRFAVAGVAAVLELDAQGTCRRAGVGVTGAGSRAVRARGVEGALTGKRLDPGAIGAAAAKAAEGVDVLADLQGSVEYKAHLVRVFARRAIEAALKRARG